jgi:hypothetical protein
MITLRAVRFSHSEAQTPVGAFLASCEFSGGEGIVPNVDAVVGQIVPAIVTEVETFGADVLDRVQSAGVDVAMSLGQRVLAWLLEHALHRGSLETAVTDLAENSQDPDTIAALRLQIRKVLVQSPELALELADMLPPAPQATATGPRSVAIAGDNSAPIITGEHSSIDYLG